MLELIMRLKFDEIKSQEPIHSDLPSAHYSKLIKTKVERIRRELDEGDGMVAAMRLNRLVGNLVTLYRVAEYRGIVNRYIADVAELETDVLKKVGFGFMVDEGHC